MRKLFFLLMIASAMFISGCSVVPPNYEGVLMTQWGKNGMKDFHLVTGNVGVVKEFFGERLYKVPMFETTGSLPEVKILAKDSGEFTIDPSYQYKPARGKGVSIVFNYKHIAGDEPTISLDNIEEKILDIIVYNAYREIAREYTTDELMNNLNKYEKEVETRLIKEFKGKYFDLVSLSSGLEPPLSMKQAIQDRNNSIQKARQVENDIQIAMQEQKIAIIERETNRIKSEGLTDKILTEKYIDMLLRTRNKVVFTDGKTLPIISTK